MAFSMVLGSAFLDDVASYQRIGLYFFMSSLLFVYTRFTSPKTFFFAIWSISDNLSQVSSDFSHRLLKKFFNLCARIWVMFTFYTKNHTNLFFLDTYHLISKKHTTMLLFVCLFVCFPLSPFALFLFKMFLLAGKLDIKNSSLKSSTTGPSDSF